LAADPKRFARATVLLASLLLIAASIAPISVAAAGPKEDRLRAFLDGKPIPLGEVGEHYCHDFDYPEIQCYSTAAELEGTTASPEMAALAAGVTYVTVYDYTLYAGSYMHISQDYWSLSTIGWNDRISSYIARNYETGSFWTDWFYGGTRWNFCCNSSVSDLGGFSNTFSSVFRT
jgi:hypothetical protein